MVPQHCVSPTDQLTNDASPSPHRPQRSVTNVGEMASRNMKVAALGRPFTLGMLYDAREDKLIPGLKLWDDETLQDRSTEITKHFSELKISASDSIESKSFLMDINASLKASFLGGLIKVEGSAKYLNDTKKFKNQSRITFQYKATTKFKELSVSDLVTMDTQQKDIIKKGLATHVVTGIEYGADAFFVFDSEKLDASSIQDIQGSMEAVIKKIPKLGVEGKVDMKLTDEEKDVTNKFSCKFYGDFILDSNVTTFEDALRTYEELPKLLGENGENSVPVKVWLMPLKHFYSEAADLMSGISVGLVMKAQNALEDLREIKMRCNDSLDDRVVKNFPVIQEELREFQKLCDYYESNLKQTMAKKFPLIREGKEDERSAVQLFEDRDKSPFSQEKLSKWLNRKEREISIITSCTMEGIKIVPNQSELDREVLAAGVDDALCFVFTSLETANPCLDVMTKYLNSCTSECTHEDPWYFSDEVFITMREKAKSFRNIARGLKHSSRFRFLVTAMANKKYTGATIYHYKNGRLVTEDFSKPDIPPVEKITDRRDLIWYACDLHLDPNTANNYLTLSEGNKKATCGSWQTYPDHPERFDEYTQVLCKDGLTGRHYWEVEWNNCSYESIYICAAYKGIARKGDIQQAEFGNNTMSWAFGKTSYGGAQFKAFHDGEVWGEYSPCDWNRVGVYLDWPAGTLSFYRVSVNTLSHLYTFHTKFTDHLYPGLWVYYDSNYAYLCQL
ncbi:neoverrucotoxin subunit beta-like [Symphorus nematophorus]